MPNLGAAPPKSGATFRPGPGGVAFENNFGRQKIVVSPEYSSETGLSVGAALATMLGDDAAVGVVLTSGADKKEWLLNAGYKLDARQRFVVSAGQLEQFLDYAFRSGNEKVGMTQNSGALSYQLQLGQEFLRFLEVNGYVAKTDSRNLADKTFAIDTATLYELWNDPRRIAGGKVTGLQGRLGFSPIAGSTVAVSFGQERLSYDLLAGSDNVNRFTGGVEWMQQLGSGYRLKLAADTFASQNRFSAGLERGIAGSGGRHNLGVNLLSLRGRDGVGDDDQLLLTYTYVFGASGNAIAPSRPARPTAGQTEAWSGASLLDQVAQRPRFIPSHVLAKVDKTALPTRLVVVDKTALPAGSSVNAATGDVTVPLGVVVTGIAGVTKNLAVFANGGQFGLSGNSLVIKPSLITQPAVGVTDSYVVTVNNFGGGTTLVTVLISHGSVRIDSIVVAAGGPDVTAPTTTAAPSVSGTTATGTTLSATINENGTGYYLVLAAAAAAPSVAAVQAGTSFAMTANVAATPSIGGLTASTAYKVWFVAKDAANNVQAAVQSVAVTTTAVVDVTPPTTTAGPSISVAATDTTASVTQTINENGTGYYLVLPAASAAPSVAAVKAGTSFAMTAATPAVVALTGLTPSTAYKYYFVAKDAANNDQAAVSAGLAITTTATVDVTPPPTPATLALTGNAGALAGFTNTQSLSLAVAAVADPSGVSWFVSESSSAPAVGDGGWSSTQPTSFTLSAGDGAKNVYVYVKDNVGNVQATGRSASIALDTALPTIAARAAWGVAASGATVAGRSVTFNDTAGGTAKTVAVTTSSGSIANLVAGAFGAATTFDFVAPANNTAAAVNVTITYSVTDKSGNVSSTTDTVSVAPAIPATPTGLNITWPTMSWTAVAGAVSYTVENLTTLDPNIYTGAATSFDLSASSASNDTLSITATNASGTSAAATIVVP